MFDGFNGDDNFGSSVLDRSESVNISHAGGELHELTRQLISDFWKGNSQTCGHRADYRTRRDRTRCCTEAFDQQMSALTHAYLDWNLANGGSDGSQAIDCVVVLMPSHYALDTERLPLTILLTDSFIASALVRQGVVLCSPISPSTGVTMQALNFYHIAHQRNPHFSIQAYVQFHRYLSCQFSIMLDVYLQTLSDVKSLVHEAIGCSNSNWCLMHVCPACTYTLKDEDTLKFHLLYTMDGNDSLKQVLKKVVRDDSEYLDDDNDIPLPRSAELPSTQSVGGDQYLTRDYVNSFTGDSSVDMLSVDDKENPCAGHWNNMKDEKTRRMWGVFDESGIFMAVCRHGFSLIIMDMVQSGKQSKYPLAVVSKLLKVFGKDLGGGYDIGCRFKTTLNQSVLGQSACELNHTSLIGAFHGHAHKHLCQLDHLTTYVKGLGLENLEGCEQTFSKLNTLTSLVCYSSIFHRHQAIANYFQHTDDFEVYANLSTFLYNNYTQALGILHNGQSMLPQFMCELGITNDSIFENWLVEECAYLMLLNQEPKQETLQMEYWQKLVNMTASKKDLDVASVPWSISTPSSASFGSRDIATTIRIETAHRHAIENYEKDLKVLEVKLRDVGCLVANRKFQWALDSLEGLVVARIFELSKMNRYKLQKHIGRALQACSAAIQMALNCYNTAACALSPPHARQDVSQHAWATPTGRLAMDTYYKMQHAREEIQRLNIKVKRMVTYLRDEDLYLCKCEKQLQIIHPALAYQVSVHCNIYARFTEHHFCRLVSMSKLHGFTGSLSPGVTSEESPGAKNVEDGIVDLDDEEGVEVDWEEQSRILEDILQVTFDV
ncbi:uncharacterized protein F5891DRAFT_1131416 [Suillus fuscotomentosus]|uniref:Uncharacterized protein n=1 Tax=Suillus fuscotomentosus TaxID=1912939 RepID=A0AAD4HEA4_9AGAM|nr:uncharacterized protein F5891DRAFT_1131416 [Suillus fuscotomentosus]KAG1893006.1 hypothetical protein F5891DRAFT_1131416 [Suillus fuscotomentosus]